MSLSKSVLAALTATLLMGAVTAQGDTAPRFTVSADQTTVQDGVTGLTWQRAVDAKALTWKDAFDYCKSLDLAQHQDWRLPVLKEMLSLVTEPVKPSLIYIDAAAFPGTPADLFWTASANPNKIAGVFFDMSKFPTGLGPKANLGHIRCVRGTLDAAYVVPQSASYNLMTIPRGLGQ